MPTRSGAHKQSRRLSWDKVYTKELFRRYRFEADEAARDELITMYLNLVKYLASRFRNRGEVGFNHLRYGDASQFRVLLRARNHAAIHAQGKLCHVRIISGTVYV